MVKTLFLILSLTLLLIMCGQEVAVPPETHPDTSSWPDLFAPDLSNAIDADTVWTFQDSLLVPNEDKNLWTAEQYDNFILDLEFKTADSTNSGVIVYCSDIENWIPNSVEIQIADDYSEQWSSMPKTWQCGAVFGHAAADTSAVKPPGQWNRYTITCVDSMIWVMLNNELVNEVNLNRYTSATENPDGSEIPSWLSTPLAELPTHGHIGLQGKHADAPVYFKNIKIKVLEK